MFQRGLVRRVGQRKLTERVGGIFEFDLAVCAHQEAVIFAEDVEALALGVPFFEGEGGLDGLVGAFEIFSASVGLCGEAEWAEEAGVCGSAF